MNSNVAVKFLPVVSDEKRVEVSLEDDKAVIKLSTWTEGLGWCGQKTLAVDADMLEDLHRAITAARLRLKNQKAENNDNSESARVLHFPKLS